MINLLKKEKEKINDIIYLVKDFLYINDKELEKYFNDIEKISSFLYSHNVTHKLVIKNYLNYLKNKKIHFKNWTNINTLNNFFEYYRNTQNHIEGFEITKDYFQKNFTKTNKISFQIEKIANIFPIEIKTCNISIWFIVIFEKEIDLRNILGEYNYNTINFYYDKKKWYAKKKIKENEFLFFYKQFLQFLNNENFVL